MSDASAPTTLPDRVAPAPAPRVHHDQDDAARVGRRLALAFAGGTLVLVGLVAKTTGIYAPAVADTASALGALLLAFPIVRRAGKNVLEGTLDLDELIALAIVAAVAFEDYTTAGAVAFFATLGELVERRTALGARAAIESLVRLTPTVARVVQADGSEVEREATTCARATSSACAPATTCPPTASFDRAARPSTRSRSRARASPPRRVPTIKSSRGP